MEVWPAIDIRDGKCVRLCQGDFSREIVYAEDPVEMARHWHRLGARRLHLVDLDGARLGQPKNLSVVIKIVEKTGLDCEFGGGIRDRETIQAVLNTGVKRVVIGTRAVTEPDWFRDMCRQFPGQVVLGIDARGGRVATHGWVETTSISAVEFARQFGGEPMAAIVYTDVACDGMLQGVNVPAMVEMQHAVPVPVIASGGITTLEDIRQLRAGGLAGCILGRALYEGVLSLPDALAVAGDVDPVQG